MNIESSERLGGRDTIAWLACYRRLNQLRDGTLRNFEADGRRQPPSERTIVALRVRP